MSQTRTKEELVRLAWQTEMRQHPERQCRGSTAPGNRVCALMLLAEMTGLNKNYWKTSAGDFYRKVGATAGLTGHQVGVVIHANDKTVPVPFPAIADMVDSWFPAARS